MIKPSISNYFCNLFKDIDKNIVQLSSTTSYIWESLINIKLANWAEQNEFYKLMISVFESGGIPIGWEFEDPKNPLMEYIDKDKVATEGLQGRKLVVFWPHEQDPEFV